MIDEFQDTSTVQWQNFKVLMRECMSHIGSENLIVGDVKQSVYRWRSGDWRLLNNINQQFSSEMMEIRPLQTNYRSERNIITFNNAFFTSAAQQEQEALSERDPAGAQQLKDAYADVCQQIPENRKPLGYVEVRLLPAKDYRERTLEQLRDTVEMLLGQGVSANNIAILVRTNDIITLIANYFAEQMPEVSIVSDEAFRLDASVSVRLLIDSLHLLTHPADLLTKAQLIKTYHRDVLGEDCSDSVLLLRNIDPDDLLPASYIAHFDELLMLPLYELVERLYDIFELHRLKDQSAYICAFYDCLTEFTMENSTGIDAFIETWELELHEKTIQSDEQHGIRILTIHKSKGLEYDHVLLPFCDWQMERSETIWCEPSEEPFCELPVAPIDYSSKMIGTIYEGDYLNEHLQLTVDNLNLLYVAFTRACKNLFVMGKRKTKSSRSAIIEKVLPELNMDGATLQGMEDEQEDIFFSYGSLYIDQHKQRKDTDNVFLQSSQPLSI
jgi:ATP-dependent exoDNAse (exonuclease V) beta subunit